MGMDADNIDPRNIRLYGNGNGMLPESNNKERSDDLVENAILVIGEEDGSFDANDYILFYGQGASEWYFNYFTGAFEQIKNLYTDEVNYFITADLGPGKRVIQQPEIQDDPTHITNTFLDYRVHEIDELNILKSGKIWFGEEYKTQLVHNYFFNFKDIVKTEPVFLRTNIAARSTEDSVFDFFYNGTNILTAPINNISINSTIYAWSITPSVVSFNAVADDITIDVEYSSFGNCCVCISYILQTHRFA
jgi:hypothetical protein